MDCREEGMRQEGQFGGGFCSPAEQWWWLELTAEVADEEELGERPSRTRWGIAFWAWEMGRGEEEGPAWYPVISLIFPSVLPYSSISSSQEKWEWAREIVTLISHCQIQWFGILCRAWSLWGLILSVVDTLWINNTSQVTLDSEPQSFIPWESLHYSFVALSMVSTSFTLKTSVPMCHRKHLH